MMMKNQTIWHPLEAEYVQDDMPDGYDFFALLDGENGPMVGNFYDDREVPGRFVVKVSTPAGLIDAKLLGCKTLTLVEWPERESADSPMTIEDMVAQLLHADELARSADGLLLKARQGYYEMAETRRAGEPIEHMINPLRTFPAEVFEKCVGIVDEEIVRRTDRRTVKLEANPDSFIGVPPVTTYPTDDTADRANRVVTGEELSTLSDSELLRLLGKFERWVNTSSPDDYVIGEDTNNRAVWERCSANVQQEIDRRVGRDRVYEAEVVTNPTKGILSLIEDAMQGGAHG